MKLAFVLNRDVGNIHRRSQRQHHELARNRRGYPPSQQAQNAHIFGVEMSNATNRFETFWRKLDLRSSRQQIVHPDDIPYMTPETNKGLALHLLPLAVNGSLKRADVVILMLNSGFGDGDALWETAHPNEHQVMLASQRANLHQSHGSEEQYPFYDLNPLFRDHPGAAYWKGGANLAVAKRQAKKLGSIAARLSDVWNAPLETVYRGISNHVAVVELLAYRSTEFKHERLFSKLPSCAAALNLVRALVAEDQKLIVVPRRVKEWGFVGCGDNTENLIVYNPNQGRAASLTTRSAGGQAILARLKPFAPFAKS